MQEDSEDPTYQVGGRPAQPSTGLQPPSLEDQEALLVEALQPIVQFLIETVPGINATPDVAAKAPAANPEYRPPPFGQQQAPPHLPDSLTRQSQQRQAPPPAFGGISEEMLAGMSKHERALLSANAGNIVDVNAAQMKAGAEAWVQPGGDGFVSDFAGKASKPSGRSKSKHQITSLVYDLAQKEV